MVQTGFLIGIPTTMVEDVSPSLKAIDDAVMDHPKVSFLKVHFKVYFILKTCTLGMQAFTKLLRCTLGLRMETCNFVSFMSFFRSVDCVVGRQPFTPRANQISIPGSRSCGGT